MNSDVEIELGRQILKAHVNQNKYFRFRGRAVKPAVNPELRARGCLSQKLATAASPQRWTVSLPACSVSSVVSGLFVVS